MNIQAFFDSYLAAFNKKDLDTLLKHFHSPCLIIFGERISAYASHDELKQNLLSLFQIYRQKGYSEASYVIQSQLAFNPTNHLVKVLWTIKDQNNKELAQFSTHYQLHTNKNDTKIVVATNLEEKL